MKLEPNKVYKIYIYNPPMYLPTLSIKGSADIYVSLSGEKPADKSEMMKIDEFENNKINTINGMFRWLLADYDDENSLVEECGLITSPFKAGV